jgi:DNA-binding NarL/FixJ family response regulator
VGTQCSRYSAGVIHCNATDLNIANGNWQGQLVRILIAEDRQIVRMALAQRIAESDPDWFICGEAMDGREAVEKAKKLKPDVVVLDYAMPVLDGIKAGREVLAILPGVGVLVYTFMVFPAMERMAIDAGIHAVVQKADSSALIAEIRKLQDRKSTLGAAAVRNGAIREAEVEEPPSADGEPV